MIVFGPSLPEKPYHFSSQLLFWQGTAAFWPAAVSAQNPHQKKIICGRRNIRTSFCPLVIVEAILAGRLAPVEHTDSGTDLRDASELADNIQDSATGDFALVWLQGLPATSAQPQRATFDFSSDSGPLLRPSLFHRRPPPEQTARFWRAFADCPAPMPQGVLGKGS